MGIVRLLIILAVIWLITLFVRRYLLQNKQLKKNKTPPPMAKMVRCEQCGTHVPASEAVAEDGRYFCSEEHRRAFADS